MNEENHMNKNKLPKGKEFKFLKLLEQAWQEGFNAAMQQIEESKPKKRKRRCLNPVEW